MVWQLNNKSTDDNFVPDPCTILHDSTVSVQAIVFYSKAEASVVGKEISAADRAYGVAISNVHGIAQDKTLHSVCAPPRSAMFSGVFKL